MNDKLYKGRRFDPDNPSTKAVTLIGNSGWDDFQFLFFDPEGILYGVYDDKLYKLEGSVSRSCWRLDWNSNTCGKTWMVQLQFLLFDPKGILHGVEKGRFHTGPSHICICKWPMVKNIHPDWRWGVGWFSFPFLTGWHLVWRQRWQVYKRSSPTAENDDWSGTAEMIGAGGWELSKFLMTPLEWEPGSYCNSAIQRWEHRLD